MTSASMTFGRPTRVAIPRPSLWFNQLASGLIQSLRMLDQWQLKKAEQEPKTAEEVLAWARRIERTEPGFAADLRSAALRSLGQNEQR